MSQSCGNDTRAGKLSETTCELSEQQRWEALQDSFALELNTQLRQLERAHDFDGTVSLARSSLGILVRCRSSSLDALLGELRAFRGRQFT